MIWTSPPTLRTTTEQGAEEEGASVRPSRVLWLCDRTSTLSRSGRQTGDRWCWKTHQAVSTSRCSKRIGHPALPWLSASLERLTFGLASCVSLEEIRGSLQRAPFTLVPIVEPLEVEVIGLDRSRRAAEVLAAVHPELDLKGLDDVLRDLVLDGEDVFHAPVKTFGPDLETVVDIDELNRVREMLRLLDGVESIVR